MIKFYIKNINCKPWSLWKKWMKDSLFLHKKLKKVSKNVTKMTIFAAIPV